ncbi:hypothetical protein [Pandoraea sputorum]|uniref:Uncharacterized protein n=1 Tax=Pandoraea sputorum TaxID=93222 RepID=A0A5E5BKA1_9BURK|nr:hypothetical protein [Pandoraea sputorum]VVE84973.1 hypothetical protein PSP31121_05021 [Pandoraea sputorum]
MALRCKPGDLAYITHSDFPSNIGRVVSVIECVGVLYGQVNWEVRGRGGFDVWDDEHQCDSRSDSMCVPDEDLRPIGGVPVHDDIRDEVPA